MQGKAWKNKTAWRLALENWRLCHEAVYLRDGYSCMIPGCDVKDELQLDHGITRSKRAVFFDIRHLGFLCPMHHGHKSFRHGDWVDKMVDQIHIQREGSAVWDDLCHAETKGGFQTVYVQEEWNKRLKEEIQELSDL